MPMKAQGFIEWACRLQIRWPLAPKPSFRSAAPVSCLTRLIWCLEKPVAEVTLILPAPLQRHRLGGISVSAEGPKIRSVSV
jgi:hypothetical protein